MMERAEDLGLSLSLSSSLAAAPRTHHVAAMLLRSPEKKRFLETMPLLPAKRSEASAEEGLLLRGGSDEEDGGCGIDGSRKKLRLSKDQSAVLEDSFREHPTLNPVSIPAEGSLGAAARPAAPAGGGVVPEQTRQDQAEADGGGLRVPEALLRDADGGEPAAAQGGAGAPRAQARVAAPLHAHVPAHHPHHVPLLRARLLQRQLRRRRPPRCRRRRRRHLPPPDRRPAAAVMTAGENDRHMIDRSRHQ